MPVPAPNFGQPPWSLEAPTEPGEYWVRRGDMLVNVEVTRGPEGLLVTMADGEPDPIGEFIGGTLEWKPL